MAVFSTAYSQRLTDIEWLAGDWECNLNGLTTLESWSYMNDSTLVGSSITTKDDGSVVSEEALRIQVRQESVKYIAVLPFKIAEFNLRKLEAETFVFENLENPFPSSIHYQKTKTGLQIKLEGNEKEEVMSFTKKD